MNTKLWWRIELKKLSRSFRTVDAICVCKACENNLDSVSCSIPRNKLVVVTGPSGSGKTSLVFNTIYAEAKRRFLETLIPTKARLFGKLEHPEVESISGLSFVSALGPSGAVSRYATVATLTQIYEYLRLVFFHSGVPHCLQCSEPLYKHTRKEMLSKVISLAQVRTVYILAPLGEMEFAELKTKCSDLSSQGFTRVRVNEKLLRLDEKILPSGNSTYNLELFVDVIPPGDVSGLAPRIIDALDIALSFGSGNVIVNAVNGTEQQMQFSEVLRCKGCGDIQKPIELSSFTYYNAICACSVCAGGGYVEDKEIVQERICTECLGARVGKEAANYHLLDRSFGEVFLGTIRELGVWSEGLLKQFDEREVDTNDEAKFADLNDMLSLAVCELSERVKYLENIGLGYLSLNRTISSLSRGEMQRAQLVSMLGASVQGVIYVVDEPTSGLHPIDTSRLVSALRKLVRDGNSVILIEHDMDVIAEADYILDMGPGAGRMGGKLVASGSPRELIAAARDKKESRTAVRLLELKKRKSVIVSKHSVAKSTGDELVVSEANKHNLNKVTCRIPLNAFVAVCGVSGSGKSSLVVDTLVPLLKGVLDPKRKSLVSDYYLPCEVSEVSGFEKLDRVLDSLVPSQRANHRSIVATVVNVLKPLRELFALATESRVRGYTDRHFAFNLPAGRCLHCKGTGFEDVVFESNVSAVMVCKHCGGRRYSDKVEEVHYRGLSISDVLELTVDEAIVKFENVIKVSEPLELLKEIGLGYLKLSQRTSTLSAGEYHRLKLTSDLVTRKSGKTLYVFDEPSEGLHADEVEILVKLFRRLVVSGNSVLVIEHNVELLREADYILELGPGAGDDGGRIIASGVLGEVLETEESRIREFL